MPRQVLRGTENKGTAKIEIRNGITTFNYAMGNLTHFALKADNEIGLTHLTLIRGTKKPPFPDNSTNINLIFIT